MFLLNLFKRRIDTSESHSPQDNVAIEVQSKRKCPFDVDLVVQVARKHPFYSSDSLYPLSPTEIERLIAQPRPHPHSDSPLSNFPITQKQDL
jgi:hypothetical protein